MRKLMQMLGFGEEDDYEDSEDYPEEPQRPPKKPAHGRRGMYLPGIVLFKGIPSERRKLQLRDALLEGVMVLMDLHDLDARQFEEEGRPLINFMGGVAFAHKGRMEQVGPALYLVMPRGDMFEDWAEEEPLNDGTFDRQGR